MIPVHRRKSSPIRRPAAGLLIAAVVAIPVLLLAVTAWRDRVHVTEQVAREVEADRDILYQHAQSIFVTHDVIARSILTRVKGMGWDEIAQSRGVHDYMTDLAKAFPEVNSIWLTDANGIARASSMMFPVPHLDVTHREYYQLLKTTDLPVVVAKPFTTMVGKPVEVFNISFRITNPDGSFGGFVGTAINTEYFKKVFGTMDDAGEPGGSSSLFRYDGAVLVRSPPFPPGQEPTYATDPELIELFQQSRKGSFERTSVADGKWRHYAFAHIDGFPVIIGRGISKDTIDARWHRNLLSYLAFFASALAMLLLLAFAAWRQHRMLQANAENLEDIVEERTRHLNAALEEKTAFFREVHHRVKNNLQIISSLARLQGAHGGDNKSLERRIQAMALVHELLYAKAEATNLDLSEYIPRLCNALVETAGLGAHCTVDAQKLPIDLERAVPLALIVSEVVTNAFKHGRRGSQPLQVKVRLFQEGEDMVLEVADDGVGYDPGAISGKGFGLKLIRALSLQLEGTAEFASAGGTTFTLRFPAVRPQREAARARTA